MSAGPPAITCTACNRRFAWKPHLAGRTITCKCGAPLTVQNAPGTSLISPKLSAILGLSVLLAIGGGAYFILNRPNSAPAPAPALESLPDALAPAVAAPADTHFDPQADVLAQITAGNSKEASQWLSTFPNRSVTGYRWTHEQTQKYVELWYARGAQSVLAFGNSFWTSSLAIELPDDPAKRKFFFDFADFFYAGKEHLGYPVQTDMNQKYLVIYFINPNPKPLDLSQLGLPRR